MVNGCKRFNIADAIGGFGTTSGGMITNDANKWIFRQPNGTVKMYYFTDSGAQEVVQVDD